MFESLRLFHIGFLFIFNFLLSLCLLKFGQVYFFSAFQVQILFTALGTCLLSSAGFHVVSIFLVFEAPQESWDIHLNPLKTIVDLHLLGSMELIKCQDVAVGLDLFFAFSNGDSSDVCHSLFSKHYCHPQL